MLSPGGYKRQRRKIASPMLVNWLCINWQGDFKSI